MMSTQDEPVTAPSITIEQRMHIITEKFWLGIEPAELVRASDQRRITELLRSVYGIAHAIFCLYRGPSWRASFEVTCATNLIPAEEVEQTALAVVRNYLAERIALRNPQVEMRGQEPVPSIIMEIDTNIRVCALGYGKDLFPLLEQIPGVASVLFSNSGYGLSIRMRHDANRNDVYAAAEAIILEFLAGQTQHSDEGYGADYYCDGCGTLVGGHEESCPVCGAIQAAM